MMRSNSAVPQPRRASAPSALACEPLQKTARARTRDEEMQPEEDSSISDVHGKKGRGGDASCLNQDDIKIELAQPSIDTLIDNNQEEDQHLKLDDININIFVPQEDSPSSFKIRDDADADDNGRDIVTEITRSSSSSSLSFPVELSSSVRPALAAAWIISWDNNAKAVWPQNLADIFPFERRIVIVTEDASKYEIVSEIASDSSGATSDKGIHADAHRLAYLQARREKARRHNRHVAHHLLWRADMRTAVAKTRRENIDAKLERASARREAWLAELRVMASRYRRNREQPHEDVRFTSRQDAQRHRQSQAAAVRALVLKNKSIRAGFVGERAKGVAADMADLNSQYEAIAYHELQERLARAELRRMIYLDKRRLIAGRHGNYVKSVYLTNQYMERREGERLDLVLEAAQARRVAVLDAKASRARRHNASVQFRTQCAFRLFDAQWLNLALRATHAQQRATARREEGIAKKLDALQAAAVRRYDVLERRRHDVEAQGDRISMTLRLRLDSATARRTNFLAAKVAAIVEKRNFLRAHQHSTSLQTRRMRLFLLNDRIEQASRRRWAFLERRRNVLATRNWYAKVLAHRHVEARAEMAAFTLETWKAKLTDAATRRRSESLPLFAQLVALRHTRVEHVLRSHAQLVARVVSRKAALAAIRLAELAHERAKTVHRKWLRVQQVKERREHDVVFRRQCVASESFARLRSAEIRRALLHDSIRAAAEEVAARGEAARCRVSHLANSTRAYMEFRLLRAQEKRAQMQADKCSTAVYFAARGKVVQTRQANRVEAIRLGLQYSIDSANLRKAIALTHRARKQMIHRAVVISRKTCLAEAEAARDAGRQAKFDDAIDRHARVLQAKQDLARRTIRRVTLTRLERQSSNVVDAAIKTAMASTIALQAEARRSTFLAARQEEAARRNTKARHVAQSQKTKYRLAAEATYEESIGRMVDTAKRRKAWLRLKQPGSIDTKTAAAWEGLEIIGRAIFPPTCATQLA